MASVPEPAPINKGVEVTPLLLNWLNQNGASESTLSLIHARHQYGLKKYGQGLMTEDGRNTFEDARQEAGDLLQYLFKAHLRGERPTPEELAQFREVLVHCEVIMKKLEA